MLPASATIATTAAIITHDGPRGRSAGAAGLPPRAFSAGFPAAAGLVGRFAITSPFIPHCPWSMSTSPRSY